MCPLLKGKYLLLNRGKYFYEYNFAFYIFSLNLLLCQFDQRLNNNLGENKAKKNRKKIASWWSQALKLDSEILLVKGAQETKIGEDKKQGTRAHYLPELPTARFWAVNLLFGDGVDVFGDKLVCGPSPALSYTCAWEKNAWSKKDLSRIINMLDNFGHRDGRVPDEVRHSSFSHRQRADRLREHGCTRKHLTMWLPSSCCAKQIWFWLLEFEIWAPHLLGKKWEKITCVFCCCGTGRMR